jgi:pimeloyl-ACP methyl ester carboxylesterase
MGGMIAQTLAIEHPEKVLSLTSIMSTTGDRDVGQPTGAAVERLLVRPPADRDGYVAHSVATSKVIGSPGLVDDERVRELAGRSFDRCYDPGGVGRQLLAIVASGSRTERLRSLDIPALVIHGTADPLVQPDGGRRTAEAIRGAELVTIEGMGHDLPRPFRPQVVDAICALTGRVGAAR